MQRLMLVHGIGRAFEGWYERIEETAEPFFEYRPLRYSAYRHFGIPKVVFTSRLRKKTFEKLRQEYEDAIAGHRSPPCLIAHSWGTVLCADLMGKYPWIRFNRIVFVGSPLSEQHDWQGMLSRNPGQFLELRNETGGKDWLVQLAGALGLIRRSLGRAGRLGFLGPGTHHLNGPLERCDECENEARTGRTVKVHNAPLKEYAHSDMFLSPMHFNELWLPYFWGITPCNYLKFQELCAEIREHDEAFLPVELDAARDKLSELTLLGSDGAYEAFFMYVGRVLYRMAELQRVTLPLHLLCELIEVAIDGVCESVVTALAERTKDRNCRDLSIVKNLYPRYAVARAVEQLLAAIRLSE